MWLNVEFCLFFLFFLEGIFLDLYLLTPHDKTSLVCPNVSIFFEVLWWKAVQIHIGSVLIYLRISIFISADTLSTFVGKCSSSISCFLTNTFEMCVMAFVTNKGNVKMSN